jgi:hypothetical protein
MSGLEQAVSYVGLFIATLFLGHQVSKTPLRQLGQRPMGCDLWGWLVHFASDGVGIWGYDSSLGCWSPPVRLLLHASFAGILHALFGIFSVALYAAFCFYYNHMVPNVSHPGGARAHKIQRVPQFPDVVSVLDEADVKAWRLVVADESHKDTARKFEGVSGAQLTGESVGRQTWTAHPNRNSKGRKVDEKLVQELAAGGRSPRGAFHPSKNPNRFV